MLLQLWLFWGGTDEKGLYPALHPGWIASCVLSIMVLAFVWLVTRQPGNNQSYKANFQASLPGALGCLAAAIVTAGGKGNVKREAMHMGAFFRMLNARGYEAHFALSANTDTFPADRDEEAKEQVRAIARWLNSPEPPPEFTNPQICAYRK